MKSLITKEIIGLVHEAMSKPGRKIQIHDKGEIDLERIKITVAPKVMAMIEMLHLVGFTIEETQDEIMELSYSNDLTENYWQY